MNIGLIQIDAHRGFCTECGEEGYLLPFGVNGAHICGRCGHKPEHEGRVKEIIKTLVDKVMDRELVHPDQMN